MRKLEADPLLNTRLKRHIKSLNLRSVEEYRSWCSAHGFRSTLSKNRNQLADELRKAAAETRALRSDARLASHMEKLGFGTTEEYLSWCRSEKLSTSLRKSEEQRKKEIQIKERLDFNSAPYLSGAGNPVETIRELASGRLNPESITNPALKRVGTLLQQPECTEERRRLLVRLLVAVLPRADFLDLNPVVAQFGNSVANTLVSAMYAIACHAEKWIDAPESWNPSPKGLNKRFCDLVRHLFARYQIPAFMDTCWFAGSDPFAMDQQSWFIHVGQGGNIRKMVIPLVFTKKMAHLFMHTPDTFTIIEAIRRAQVLALEGNEDLVGHLNATHLGEQIDHEQFWISVIHFFINNPMLDLSYVGPIIDYIDQQKFLPVQAIADDGEVVVLDPPDPNFSMKGRKPEPFLELVDAWHRGLAKEKKTRGASNWEPSGISRYEDYEENSQTGHIQRWSITELVTRKAIFDEGKSMKHCVKSYLPSCMKGIKSVWSLQVEDMDTNRKRRVLTIAVKNDIRKVVQARGKCNAMPGMRPNSPQEAQALKREHDLLEKGREIMRKWGSENEIVVPLYT